jgi:hypothetical protein
MGWDDKIVPWDYLVCPIPSHGIPKKNFPSHPIPWDSKKKLPVPSHPMGFVILQKNSIEDLTYFYTVT